MKVVLVKWKAATSSVQKLWEASLIQHSLQEFLLPKRNIFGHLCIFSADTGGGLMYGNPAPEM